jgi:hypothetical protein
MLGYGIFTVFGEGLSGEHYIFPTTEVNFRVFSKTPS